MYLGYLVDVPDKKGKITFRQKGNAKYVYYEYDRVYDPERKYTIVKRSTIGKLSEEDPDKMRPNENFRKFFPEVEAPGEREDAGRSSALKAGTYMVINQVVTSCGCTVATYTKKPIAPGASGTIKVKYDGKGRFPSHIKKMITVRTNGVPEMVRLYVEGDMVDEQK